MTSNSSKKADNLRNRLIFGFSGFFLMLGGIIWAGWTYFIVFAVISQVCLYEYLSLYRERGQGMFFNYCLALGLGIFTLSFLISAEVVDTMGYLWVYPLFSMFFLAQLYRKEQKFPFEKIGLVLLGILYTTLPFVFLNILAFKEGEYQYQYVLGLFFILWIHDIGAYFIGGRYGKHPLFPRISPKKSWEGSFGGAFLALAMALLLNQYLHDLALYQWIGVALIIIVAGTHGDLIESMLKRSLLVKDSGETLPGHGGFLDRFDNLLFSAPFIAIFLKFF